jgi:hypothetical protein
MQTFRDVEDQIERSLAQGRSLSVCHRRVGLGVAAKGFTRHASCHAYGLLPSGAIGRGGEMVDEIEDMTNADNVVPQRLERSLKGINRLNAVKLSLCIDRIIGTLRNLSADVVGQPNAHGGYPFRNVATFSREVWREAADI